MTDELLAYSIDKMKEYGIVDSGDTLKLGIGAMTDARMASFFDKMVRAGVIKPTIDSASRIRCNSSTRAWAGFAAEELGKSAPSCRPCAGHPRLSCDRLRPSKTWMAGTSPAMTKVFIQHQLHRDAERRHHAHTSIKLRCRPKASTAAMTASADARRSSESGIEREVAQPADARLRPLRTARAARTRP